MRTQNTRNTNCKSGGSHFQVRDAVNWIDSIQELEKLYELELSIHRMAFQVKVERTMAFHVD